VGQKYSNPTKEFKESTQCVGNNMSNICIYGVAYQICSVNRI